MDSYDEIPYDSTPVTETHPDRLAVVGRLFGIGVAPPDRCRVLELGCAAGGNLVPLAWRYPGSEFVGVELAARQVADGRRLVESLGLTNVDIRQADIMDLDAGLGEFDYLVCHGVYSWVPEPVREKILDLCAAVLAPGGLAYVSYNTLPGWRTKGMLRDMLLYHTRRARTPAERLTLAYGFMEFIQSATANLDAVNVRALRQQIGRIREAGDSYLYHEYLESTNEPVLFSDFMAGAEARGLAYVADTELHTLFPATLGDEVDAALDGIGEAIEQEQYLDFVLNRNFRQTLLCHKEALGERELDLEAFESLAFFADLVPPSKVELRRPKSQMFGRRDGESLRVEHPLTKAALVHLGIRYPDSVGYDELAAAARQAVAARGGGRHADEIGNLFGELFSLFLHQAVGASTRAETFPRLQGKPKASGLARSQVAAQLGHVATARHTTLSLDPLAARLITLLDGSRDPAALVEAMCADIVAEPSLAPEWAGFADKPERLASRVREACERLLALFAAQGILDGGAVEDRNAEAVTNG